LIFQAGEEATRRIITEAEERAAAAEAMATAAEEENEASLSALEAERDALTTLVGDLESKNDELETGLEGAVAAEVTAPMSFTYKHTCTCARTALRIRACICARPEILDPKLVCAGVSNVRIHMHTCVRAFLTFCLFFGSGGQGQD
jgi:hypothetical protein